MKADPCQRLVYMANQIARNFAAQGEGVAIAATAEHLHLFWDPRMRETIQTCDQSGLIPIARQAVQSLSARMQTRSANADWMD